MLFVEQPLLEKWSPDLSGAGLSSPVWTRLKSAGIELCNSLEWVPWQTNPVQVHICDTCGVAGCASDGYVHLSVLRNIVLWTVASSSDQTSVDRQFGPARVIGRFGCVAFPADVWTRLRESVSQVPEVAALDKADGNSLSDAWIMCRIGRPMLAKDLMPWLRGNLLAADSLNTSTALAWVERWLRWFGENSAIPLQGSLRRADAIEARIEKLYFDGPPENDWPAMARYRDVFVPALGPDYIFLPDETVRLT